MSEPELIIDNAVVGALLQIGKADEDGIIQPETVVATAADPSSPLHQHFTWDETEAAYQFRLVQARSLIRRVSVVRRPVPGPDFVNVTVRRSDGEPRRGYVPTDRAAAEPDLYAQIIEDAHRGLNAYRNRLSAFEQAHEIVAKLDVAIAATRKAKGKKVPA
jgi:hypothetical protein